MTLVQVTSESGHGRKLTRAQYSSRTYCSMQRLLDAADCVVSSWVERAKNGEVTRAQQNCPSLIQQLWWLLCQTHLGCHFGRLLAYSKIIWCIFWIRPLFYKYLLYCNLLSNVWLLPHMFIYFDCFFMC